MEAFLTRVRMFLHTGLVMSIDKIRYGLIQLHQGVKDTFTQLSIGTIAKQPKIYNKLIANVLEILYL